MAKKSFWTEKEEWTDDARKAACEVNNYLGVFFQEWMAKGYSPREIAHLVMTEASCKELEAALDIKMGKVKPSN